MMDQRRVDGKAGQRWCHLSRKRRVSGGWGRRGRSGAGKTRRGWIGAVGGANRGHEEGEDRRGRALPHGAIGGPSLYAVSMFGTCKADPFIFGCFIFLSFYLIIACQKITNPPRGKELPSPHQSSFVPFLQDSSKAIYHHTK
jgi:hypothetical protein